MESNTNKSNKLKKSIKLRSTYLSHDAWVRYNNLSKIQKNIFNDGNSNDPEYNKIYDLIID
tara:strand:+ start:80 stop:262 length:183 start_codon:yes stop_codon:yes gene_type:complete